MRLPVPACASEDPGVEAQGLEDEWALAAREVDQTLLRWMLSMTPRERLRAAAQYGRTLARFHR